MKETRRWFLTALIVLVVGQTGCSGVRKRQPNRIRRQTLRPLPPKKSTVVGRVPEGDIEVVGPDVSSRVDPLPD